MKKIWLSISTVMMAVVLCFALSACGNQSDQLTNEIGATVEGGNFKKGSVLNLNKIDVTEDDGAEILSKLRENGIGINNEEKAYIYDISVTRKKAEIQPDGTVKVTIPVPEDEKAEGYNVYHIKDNSAVEAIPSTYKDGKVSFETDSFSWYVFTPTYNFTTIVSSYTLTVSNGSNSYYGSVSVNGTAIDGTYTASLKSGESATLLATPAEGYKFTHWTVKKGAETTTVTEPSYTFVMDSMGGSATANFEFDAVGLELIGLGEGPYIYDADLLRDARRVTVKEFRTIGEALGENFAKTEETYILTAKIVYIKNDFYGNMIVSDATGSTEIYGAFNSEGTVKFGEMENPPNVGDTVTFVGVAQQYNGRAQMYNACIGDNFITIQDLESVEVRARNSRGHSKYLRNGDYYIEGIEALGREFPGEYSITYKYGDLSASVNVIIISDIVGFTANAENGTIVYEGAEHLGEFVYHFEYGFGSITLTAKGAPNTVFKGWYTNEDNPTLISTDATYTFEVTETMHVVAKFDHVATKIWLDGMNMGFDTNSGVTEVWLPINDTADDPNDIIVFAIINGERVALTENEYTIDLGGYNVQNPVKGDYTITFTYKENTALKATHIIRVIDEENMVWLDVSCDAGGRVIQDKPYNEFNKGDQVTLTVELRSESDYEFLGWYTMDASGAIGDRVSADRTYTVTLNETTYLVARIEPKVTYLDVVVGAYPTNPAKIPLAKFSFDVNVYACGALGLRNELTANDYTVDMGGLDVENAAVGKYTVTYTYKADPSIKYELVVWVWNEDHSFRAYSNSPDCGDILFEGGITADAGGQYIDGEEITVTAIEKDGFAFLGWYKVINKETHEEFELITTEQVYTFAIDADTTIMAKFDSPVIDIWLDGIGFSNQNGKNVINVYRGEKIHIGGITVYGVTFMGYDPLNADDYTVDLGGLDLDNPVAGSYVITYTYKENTELTACIYVTVLAPTYVVKVEQYHNPGYVSGAVEYEGNNHFNLFLEVEEGKTVILKAVEKRDYMFVGWYATDYNNYGEWGIYSTNATVAVKVERDIILAPVYMTPIVGLQMHRKANIYNAGVMNYEFSGAELGHWDEELGRYVAYGHIDLYADSKYATDISTIFEDFHIVAVDGNGYHKRISHEDLSFDLGDYKAEEGWYEIKVSYGTFTMTVNVMVMPAENA